MCSPDLCRTRGCGERGTQAGGRESRGERHRHEQHTREQERGASRVTVQDRMRVREPELEARPTADAADERDERDDEARIPRREPAYDTPGVEGAEGALDRARSDEGYGGHAVPS